MYSFEGKVVWVTGSSTGIGRAVALGFAAHGADVIVHCNQNLAEGESVAAEISGMGREALLVQGDVSKKNIVESMVSKINDRFGRIDILVNNAGSMVKRVRLEQLDEETWDRILDVNLKSVFLVTQAALPLMKPQGKGRIVNVTSIAARNGGSIGALAYATSKGGVSTLTRNLAKELLEYNILVNGIAPGVISTPFQDRFTPPETRQKLGNQILMGREGTPEEMVGAVLFLSSDYSNYITGEIIEINGGQLMD
ncbi:SDR family NAD(P)-dependent oxidoreductase [Ferviditalea candida]|uniref:SDR family NAD(P)-dependent oxidoreductase n=1 Tax=Ferviditalea candida TaxID=3108399 RepID=A0ABU5ZMV5_9BACL|nr:SDR family NAD(P)-dependent oxidoreductase [Paenibacillaceae bacterium T2]